MRTRSEARAAMRTRKCLLIAAIKAAYLSRAKRSLRQVWGTLANALRSHAVVPYAVALLLAVGAKLPTLNNSVLFIDEPAYLSEAARLDTPLKFLFSAHYITETKFPLGLAPYEVALWLNHSESIFWMRIFGLLAVAASTVLLVGLSYRAFQRYLPGLLASLMWSVFLTKNALTSAPMLEYFQAPLVLGALWIVAGWVKEYSAKQALRRRHLLALVGAGALIGAAALVKPPGILVAPVLALGIFLAGAGAPRRERLRASFAPLAGATAAIGLCVLPYLFWPEALHALLFNMFDLTSRYSSQQGSLPTRLAALLRLFNPADVLLVLIALGTHALIYVKTTMRWNRTERQENIIRLVLLGTSLALLIGYLAGQSKDHYIVAILPLLALYAWSVMTSAYTWLSESRSRVAYTAAWVALILIGLPMTSLPHYLSLYTAASASGEAYAAELPGVDAHILAAAIDLRTRPGDSIWVYYNAPEIYWLAHRKPATAEPVGTWLVDYYDQFWFQRTLLQLKQERPALIVGFNSPRYPRAQAAQLLELPLIGEYIQSAYTCTRASQTDVGGPAWVEFCSLRSG